MKKLKIGDKEVSELMLGMMRIDKMEDDAVYKLMLTAKEGEINALDTADCYADGVCEEKLGNVFEAHPDLRDEFFVQTKCGIRRSDSGFVYYDFSKSHIVHAVEGSLRRLHTDHIDCLLLHRPDALMEPGAIEEAFQELKKSGKVLSFGVSNQNPMMIDLLKTKVTFPIVADQLQLSCAFSPDINAGFNVNMLNDAAVVRASSIFEYCRINDIIIQAWSPMQYGFFEGVFIGSDKYPKLNEVLGRIAQEQDVTADAVAIAWILRYPAKMQVVLGTTSRTHLLAGSRAPEVTLSKEQWYEIYLAAGNTLP